MIRARNLGELVDRYDAFLVDQFGVLLDGAGAYDHARGALDELFARGKRVLLISNSGKRSAANVARLGRYGFSRATYLDVLSSGEVAHLEMARRLGASLPLGARVWVETSDDTARPLAGLDLQQVENPDAADLIWIAGCRPFSRTLGDYAALLAGAASRGVPAICSNPDMTMLTPTGKAFGAGAIAQAYETPRRRGRMVRQALSRDLRRGAAPARRDRPSPGAGGRRQPRARHSRRRPRRPRHRIGAHRRARGRQRSRADG